MDKSARKTGYSNYRGCEWVGCHVRAPLTSMIQVTSGSWYCWTHAPEDSASRSQPSAERCNRPAWRYYTTNGFRVCRDHARFNDPEEVLCDEVLGPCDYLIEPITSEGSRSAATDPQEKHQRIFGECECDACAPQGAADGP